MGGLDIHAGNGDVPKYLLGMSPLPPLPFTPLKLGGHRFLCESVGWLGSGVAMRCRTALALFMTVGLLVTGCPAYSRRGATVTRALRGRESLLRGQRLADTP